RMFREVAAISEQRSELARQLISMQETTFRSVSRELHDEFGQILTAVGSMLRRADRRNPDADPALKADLRDVREIVQTTLEKVRSLSQALHPVVLDETGLDSAIDSYLPMFEKRTGVAIRYEKTGEEPPLDREISIQLYRVLQEALNNVARHARSGHADVRLRVSTVEVVLEVEDEGVGFQKSGNGRGLGLISMKERAELVNGRVEFLEGR